MMIGNILGKTRDNDFDVSSNNPRNPKIVGSKGKYIVYNLRKSKTDQQMILMMFQSAFKLIHDNAKACDMI